MGILLFPSGNTAISPVRGTNHPVLDFQSEYFLPVEALMNQFL